MAVCQALDLAQPHASPAQFFNHAWRGLLVAKDEGVENSDIWMDSNSPAFTQVCRMRDLSHHAL